MDTEEDTLKTAEECGADFSMGYGLDPQIVSKATGAFYQIDPGSRPGPYLHPANFILQPGGKVYVSVYSSGPPGRLAWQDMLHTVQKQKERMSAAR